MKYFTILIQIHSIFKIQIQLELILYLLLLCAGYHNTSYSFNKPKWHLLYFIYLFIIFSLAVPGLSCGKQDRCCHLPGSLVVGMWDLVPWPGIEPGPLHWEHRVLTTGPPRKSLLYSKVKKLRPRWKVFVLSVYLHCNMKIFLVKFSIL